MLIDAVASLMFPPLCVHCNEEIEPKKGKLLCASCTDLLVLIEPKFRCAKCFASLEESSCLCATINGAFKAMAAACDYLGPAASLIKAYKYDKRPAIAKDLAAMMVMQFSRLNWPMPDLIVPVPQSFSHLLLRTFNQTALLAEEVGKLLQCPVHNVLKRKCGDFSQAHLRKENRLKLSSSSFLWKKHHEVEEKNILLIDDVMTTGATLKASAEILREGFPKAIYGLVFSSS